MDNIPNVAAALGVGQQRIRKLVEQGRLVVISSEAGDKVDIETARALLDNDNLRADLAETKRAYDQLKSEIVNPAKGRGQHLIDGLTAAAAVVAAGAAIWAVVVAQNQLATAVRAFQSGNEYSIQRDLISSLADLLEKNEPWQLPIVDENLRIAETLHQNKSVSAEFWATFSTRICGEIERGMCSASASAALTKKMLAQTVPNVARVCFGEKKEGDVLCNQEPETGG